MPKNRGVVGAETRSRRRKPRGRKGMGRGNLPSRQRGWGALKAPSAGSGAEPRPKTGFDAFGAMQCIFKEFSLADIAHPFLPLLSPLLFFFLYLSFPPCLSPSFPNPFPRSFPFLATKQSPKILLGVWGCTVSSPSGVRGGAPAAYRYAFLWH